MPNELALLASFVIKTRPTASLSARPQIFTYPPLGSRRAWEFDLSTIYNDQCRLIVARNGEFVAPLIPSGSSFVTMSAAELVGLEAQYIAFHRLDITRSLPVRLGGTCRTEESHHRPRTETFIITPECFRWLGVIFDSLAW